MATCVECDAEFDIDEPEVGEMINCPECGLEMEIVSSKPVELDVRLDDDEEVAAEEDGDESWG